MYSKLLIVESPAKAKTINKYLGSDFKVLSSFGHIRDLPKKNGSIDVNDNFKANYQIIAKNKKHVSEIISASKESTQIYLATDPDREGEAIAWHIAEVIKNSKGVNKKTPIFRVTFNEITAQAVKNAVLHPRELDNDLIDAQQARLTLDYLIGFNVSPLLWQKIKPGLSAGRVQSPALKLICEREAEIKAFIPQTYFSVILTAEQEKEQIFAKLIEYDNKKIETKTLVDEKQAIEICKKLSNHSKVIVTNITKKQKLKNPLPPFMTSTLQIDAARKLGFGTDKTMRVAQSLYEGIELGNEVIGLISYMRTDSVNLSTDAVNELRDYISKNYAKNYLPANVVNYTNKVRNAQEAHEAIRPTSIFRTPKQIKSYLNPEQFKLYELIWQRTLACQMEAAILDTTAVTLTAGVGVFRANGIAVHFDGFLSLYQESTEDNNGDNDESSDKNKFTKLNEGQSLKIDSIVHNSHQTEPKARFSEALLVKSLEELGIGRPSTYATIIATLKKREYVIVEKKRFIPTDIGVIVNSFLNNHLPQYVDLHFTAQLEDTLDKISNGKQQKLPILEKFWQELEQIIQDKKNIGRSELTSEKLTEKCPKCNNVLMIKLGKYGRFIGCSGYPNCDYMAKLDEAGNIDKAPLPPLEVVEGRKCPKDDGTLVIRNGKFGKFISCKNYPKCKYIENINNANANDNLNIKCPECKKGDLTTKRNRYGNIFYSCNLYPDCKTIFNYTPLNQSCPECSYPIMLDKVTKTKGNCVVCPKCKHESK
jgi:DNA topoisomerase-1